jgi:DHA1 family multidrug resistance protein-like MFS transporter
MRSFPFLSPVGLACLVVFLHYVGAYMRMPLLPLYARAGGASTAQVGLLMGAFTVVAALSAIPGGLLADRFGRRRLIVVGLAISAATSFALPASQAVPVLAGVLALAGWAMAALTPAVMAYIGEAGGPGGAGRAYGWYTTALYGGITLGPACGGIAADFGGYRFAFMVSGAALLVTWVLAVAGLPEQRAQAGGRAASLAGLRQVAANPVVVGCWGAVFCLTFAWGVLLAFLPLYAQDLGFSRRAIGGLFGLQAFCNMGMRAPVGFLSDRLGLRSPFIIVGMLAFAAGAAAIPGMESAVMLAVAIAATGVGQGIGAVAAGAALSEAVEPSVRGAAMGGYGMALYAGVAAGSLAVGPVIERAGFRAGFAVAAAVLVVGAVAFHQMTHRQRRT